MAGFRTFQLKNYLQHSLVVALFIIAGVIGLRTSSAATYAVDSEAEAGTRLGAATIVGDQDASGSAAVRFGLAATGTRDPLKQPFSSSSIWNMPIGSNAQFTPANLPAMPIGGDEWTLVPQIDDEPIFMDKSAPLTSLMQSDVGWDTSRSRCTATGGELAKVPMPSSYTLASSSDNNSAAFLMPDGRSVLQSQPLTRCTAGGIATSLLTFDPEDLYGQGIGGAHGGSRLSALGGSIRIGELRPGQQGPRHALKINVDSTSALYNCSTKADCFRWPAQTADSGATGDYGTANNNQNTAMKMGALLAIPPSVDINALGLESEPGRQIAWTLQNYGAYIVDSTGGPHYALCAETGPAGSLRDQFQADYGLELEQRVNYNTIWSRDFQRIVQKLQVINNNSGTSIGGGGTPRQPLAPPITP